MDLNLSNLQVGQKVAVGRYGSWGNVSNQGVYVVAKVNKLKVVLKREGDGYERVWSVKRGFELKQYESSDKYERDSFIESVETAEARTAAKHKEANIRGLWKTLEAAAELKDMAAVEAALAQLKSEVK